MLGWAEGLGHTNPDVHPAGCVGLCSQGPGGAEEGARALGELGWVRGALVGVVPAPITLGMVLVGADAAWSPWAEPLAWPPAPDIPQASQHLGNDAHIRAHVPALCSP